jgi:hypothetical protein
MLFMSILPLLLIEYSEEMAESAKLSAAWLSCSSNYLFLVEISRICLINSEISVFFMRVEPS